MRVFLCVTMMIAVTAMSLAPACTPTTTEEKKDEASKDAGTQDTGAKDAGTKDAGTTDTGAADTGTTDTGTTDTGTPDNAPADTGSPDQGQPDAGMMDKGPADAGSPDKAMETAPEKTAMEATPETTQEQGTTTGVPTNGQALFAWLKAGNYKNFPAESKVHQSNTAHGQAVRVFINTVLDNSLKAGNKVHPKGAALIKELWTGDMKTLRGWAVQVKTDANSNNGQGWYWYEIFSTTSPASPVADGNGVSLCTGCHSAGVDYMRTKYPLQ